MSTTDMLLARVREVIQRSGLNQSEFAAKTDLDPSKMSKSLSGVRRFTSLELANIAEAGDVTVDWLLTGRESAPAVAARAASQVALDGVDAAISRARKYAQARNDLRFLGIETSRPRPAITWDASEGRVAQCEWLASWALDAIGQPAAPSSVQFASQIEATFGIDVGIIDLERDFDGLAWVDEGASVILVGTHPVPSRQRYTIAHELGHVLAGDDQGLHVDTSISSRGQRSESEMRANAFAAALLMPASRVLEAFSQVTSHRVNDELFSRWVMELSVSPSALAYRALNLGLIDRNQQAHLANLRTWQCAVMAEATDRFARHVDESESERLPVALLRDSLRAYQEGKATLRPLANLFGLEPAVLRQALAGVVGQQGPTTEQVDDPDSLQFVP